MPYRVIFSPEAVAQLTEIYGYIAEASAASIAERFTSAIVDYCEGLAASPHRGTKRDELRPGLRTVGFRRRVTIAFSVDHDSVTIVGVFYGGQDYEAAVDQALDPD